MSPKPKFSQKQLELAEMANALSHPVRVAIIQQLQMKCTSFHGEMKLEFSIANSTFSQHLKVLKEAGIITAEEQSTKTKYCLNKQKIEYLKGLLVGFFD